MGFWNSENMIEDLNEALMEERSKNDDLHMDMGALEEEISYLRPMAKWLIEHIKDKGLTVDELDTIEKMKEDLAYFEDTNYNVEELKDEYK